MTSDNKILTAEVFQFHFGSVERQPPILLTTSIYNFNSTLVRLKVLQPQLLINFDRFQFHFGSVESTNTLQETKNNQTISIPLWFG